MGRLNARWAAWGATYLAATAVSVFAVIKLRGVFDGALKLAEWRASLIDELQESGLRAKVDEDLDDSGENAPARPVAAPDGPGA